MYMKYRNPNISPQKEAIPIKDIVDSYESYTGEIPNLREFYFKYYYSTKTTDNQISMIGKVLNLIQDGTIKVSSKVKNDVKQWKIQLQEFKKTNDKIRNFNRKIESKLKKQTEIDDLISKDYMRLERELIALLVERQDFVNTCEIKSKFFQDELESIFRLPEPLQTHQILEKLQNDVGSMTIELNGTEHTFINLVPHPIFFFQKDKKVENLIREYHTNDIPDEYTIGFLKKSGCYVRTTSPMKRLAKIYNLQIMKNIQML